MTSQNTLSRLSWSLFALRWLLVGSIVVLALLLPALDPVNGAARRGPLLLAAVIGVPVALAGLLTTTAANKRAGPGLAGLSLDMAYTLLVFWASGGMPLMLVVAGGLAVLIGALRLGGPYGQLATLVQTVAAPLLYVTVIAAGPDAAPTLAAPALAAVLLGAGGLLLTGTFISLATLAGQLGWAGQRLIMQERGAESTRLRTAREQARAIYEMASTLSASLNYQQVLDAALDLGVLGLREVGPNMRLVSAVLLFDEDTGQLKVGNARRLTRADMEKRAPGKRGVLGLALKGAEPVFAHDAHRDPELKYFVAFQDARSILAVPLRAGFDSFGVLVYGSTMPNAFSEEHVEQLSAIASQATIALQNALLYQDLLEEKERIIEVEEDARRQLSRDLHDGPTQSVAAIAMRVNYIRRLLDREPGQVPVELQKVEELARQTTKEIRHMLFTLRPLILETQGLGAAIHELAKKMRETHNENVIADIPPGIERYVDTTDQSVLFNIVDEAVNNARKYAEAEHIWVRLNRQENYLLLEVQDDGVGFDVGEVDANYDQRGSLGLLNLRERTELLDGTLRIESAEGEGTTIRVIAPIREIILRELAEEAQQEAAAEPPKGQGRLLRPKTGPLPEPVPRPPGAPVRPPGAPVKRKTGPLPDHSQNPPRRSGTGPLPEKRDE